MKKILNALLYLKFIKEKVNKSATVFLFLDYDGTLTEIKKRPEDALPGKVLVELLNDTIDNKFIISIISGRTLTDLKGLIKEVDLNEINLIGSHGSEIQLESTKGLPEAYLNWQIPFKNSIEEIKDQVLRHAKKIKGALIEEKPVSIAIHYRNIPVGESTKIDRLTDYLDYLQKSHDFRYLVMKKVIEIMPSDLNKGKAMSRIIKSYIETGIATKKYLAICIGDDITDEDLFLANRSGVNIKVKQSPGHPSNDTDTLADYYLKDPEEVICFLKNIIDQN